MDETGAPVERRSRRNYRLGHRQDVRVDDPGPCRRTNVMSMTRIVMVRAAVVRVRWNFVDIAGDMNRELHARDTSPC